MADPSKLGNKIAPRVAALTTSAVIEARRKLAPHTHDLAMQIQESFFRLTGSEIHGTLGPLWQRIADNPDMPQWAQRTFGFLANRTGQWTTLLSSGMGGQIMSVGLGALVANELAPGIQGSLALQPNTPLPVDAAVNLAARGRRDAELMEFEGRKQGLAVSRFRQLMEVAKSVPGLNEILELLHRRAIDRDDAIRMLKDALVHEDYAELLLEMQRTYLSPEALADMVVRGIAEEAAATDDATRSGIRDDDFAKLVLASGMPPAVQELLEAYRRGIIDDTRLVHGIRQSRLRNEWIDVIKALRYSPMSPADAIQAAVQGHLPDGEAKKIAEEGGLLPEHYDPLYQIAGNPPGPETTLDLWNRGIFTRDQATQALRESRLKDKYIPALLESRVQLIPARTLHTLVVHGVLTANEAIAKAIQLGYTPDDAAALIASARAEKTKPERDLTVAQVRELYATHALDKDTASAMLTNLGYEPDEVAWLLALGEAEQILRANNAAMSKIHTLYVSHHIDDTTASNALDLLHIPASQRDDLMGLWQLEREANVKLLTPAEISKAVKLTYFTPEEGITRLVRLGYSQDDASLLISFVTPQ